VAIHVCRGRFVLVGSVKRKVSFPRKFNIHVFIKNAWFKLDSSRVKLKPGFRKWEQYDKIRI
jgi:hypothetical protein